MTGHFRACTVILAGLVSVSVFLGGCDNGNLFGGLNDRGDSGDIDSLNADGAIALREKNYAAALALYERVLEQNPNNAEALYGAAAAGIGVSGLNIGQVLANLTSQTGTSAVAGFGELIMEARESISAQSTNPDSILAGVNLDALNAQIDAAICRLQRIVAGATDGTIPADDVDVILNLGALSAIRAILRPLMEEGWDTLNQNGAFEVSVDDANAFCSANPASVAAIGKDIAGAYALFNRAVALLGLSSNQVISQIRSDIDAFAAEIFGVGSPLPGSCTNAFGFDATSFRNYTGVFTDPGTC